MGRAPSLRVTSKSTDWPLTSLGGRSRQMPDGQLVIDVMDHFARLAFFTRHQAASIITSDNNPYQDLSFADAQERARIYFLPLNPDKSDYLDQSEGLAIRSEAPQRDNPTY